MKNPYRLLCTLLVLGSCSLLNAETLTLPIGQQGQSNIVSMPHHGQSQHSVLAQFGEPSQRHAAVGQPPITRWDYPGFSVFFEYTTVVNSVKHHVAQSETR